MNKCNQCGKAYKSKRSDSKYCSAKCRVTANRLSVTSVTDNDTVKEVWVYDKDTPLVSHSHPLTASGDYPANYGQDGCECGMCQNNVINKSNNIINHGEYKVASELGENEINRVSIPGDVDYDGRMVYVDGAWHQR